MKKMKTMKHNIFILLLACFSFMQATAQDMTTIHMKNGSTMSFENGRHYGTQMDIWVTSGKTWMSFQNEGHAQLEYILGNYCALLSLDRKFTLPTSNSTRSFCVGTTENLTLESCDCVIPATEVNGKLCFQLGTVDTLKKASWARTALDYKMPAIDYSLRKGQTYYWREVVTVPYLQGGQDKEAVVYDMQEHSFRIPLLMTESGLLPPEQCGKDVVYPDAAAWSAFYQKYFPDVNTQRLASMGKLWAKWIVDHQSEVTISQNLTYDDGELHLVNTVPDAFYQWIISHEVVINSLEQIIDSAKCTRTVITDVDEKWQVPGNSYIQFVSTGSTANLSFTADASETVPGIPYMLEFVFAPDDRGGNTKPTKLRIDANFNDGSTETLGENSYEIPTTEVTRLALPDAVKDFVSLSIQMRITARETSKYQRVIRLAEIRLKPQGN